MAIFFQQHALLAAAQFAIGVQYAHTFSVLIGFYPQLNYIVVGDDASIETTTHIEPEINSALLINCFVEDDEEAAALALKQVANFIS